MRIIHSLSGRSRIYLLGLLTYVALTLTACGSEQNLNNIPTKTPILTPTATISTVTPTSSTPAPTTTVSIVVPSFTLAPTNTASPNSPTINITIKPPFLQDWQNRWLKGIPCQPPCFEGITPGLTTASDAVKILQQNPIISSVKIRSYTDSPNTYVIWEWLDKSVGIAGQGGNLLYDNTSTDQSIFLAWPFFSTKFKLGDVIQAYGEPSHVIAGFDVIPEEASLDYQFALIYLNQGFVISNPQNSGKPFVKADLMLDGPKFFANGVDGLEKISPYRFARKFLVPWQGFKEYRFYCRHANGPQHIVEDCSRVPNIGAP